MLTITDTACTRLSEILDDYPEDVSARIVLRDGHLKLRRGTAQKGDEVFTHEDRTVLVLDEKIAERLERKTLDVRDTVRGPRLGFRRVGR